MLKSVLGEIAKMLESGLFGFLYRVTDVIYKLAWSNILWFFTAGFPLVFLFTGDWLLLTLMLLLISPPGTAALFHVMWVWQEDGDISIWKEYWSGLRKNWKQAYIVINPYIFIWKYLQLFAEPRITPYDLKTVAIRIGCKCREIPIGSLFGLCYREFRNCGEMFPGFLHIFSFQLHCIDP